MVIFLTLLSNAFFVFFTQFFLFWAGYGYPIIGLLILYIAFFIFTLLNREWVLAHLVLVNSVMPVVSFVVVAYLSNNM